MVGRGRCFSLAAGDGDRGGVVDATGVAKLGRGRSYLFRLHELEERRIQLESGASSAGEAGSDVAATATRSEDRTAVGKVLQGRGVLRRQGVDLPQRSEVWRALQRRYSALPD